jgi:hypothetical protein
MIPAWDVIAVSKQRPICSRWRHPESRPHRQSRSRPRMKGGMSCPRTCPTPSNISMFENWTCSLRRLSKRRSDRADCRRAFRQYTKRFGTEAAVTNGQSSPRRQLEMATVLLTRGQVNAVRAAFKAGIKPSLIARKFGLSQSDVRKALTADASERVPID